MNSAATLAFLVLTSVGGLVWTLSRIEVGLLGENAAEVTAIKAAHAIDVAALK